MDRSAQAETRIGTIVVVPVKPRDKTHSAIRWLEILKWRSKKSVQVDSQIVGFSAYILMTIVNPVALGLLGLTRIAFDVFNRSMNTCCID